MSLYTKRLLNELPSEDTVHDWVFGPKNGFLRYIGKAQQYLGRTHPKGSPFEIPFHKTNTNSIIIRFPAVGILSIIGFNVGLYGAVTFTQLYRKCHKTSILYFVLSNTFFAGMNVSGLIYHCILPNDFYWRYMFRYFDQICTGIADENDEQNNNNNNQWNNEKHKIYSIMGSAILLPMIHPIFGDIIYITGVIASVYNLLQCNIKLRQYDDDETDNELKYLKTMAKTVLGASAATAIGILGAKQVALWTKGTLNVMRTMFMFGDIGYMFTLYYGMKHYYK
eukprot:549139_1